MAMRGVCSCGFRPLLSAGANPRRSNGWLVKSRSQRKKTLIPDSVATT
jgi:hypothetical protein